MILSSSLFLVRESHLGLTKHTRVKHTTFFKTYIRVHSFQVTLVKTYVPLSDMGVINRSLRETEISRDHNMMLKSNRCV